MKLIPLIIVLLSTIKIYPNNDKFIDSSVLKIIYMLDSLNQTKFQHTCKSRVLDSLEIESMRKIDYRVLKYFNGIWEFKINNNAICNYGCISNDNRKNYYQFWMLNRDSFSFDTNYTPNIIDTIYISPGKPAYSRLISKKIGIYNCYFLCREDLDETSLVLVNNNLSIIQKLYSLEKQ